MDGFLYPKQYRNGHDLKIEKTLKLLRQIKSVTIAALNDGQPAARLIDVMLVKEDGLYFPFFSFYR